MALPMALPQVAVVLLLLSWGTHLQAAIVAGLLVAQILLMMTLLTAPKDRAAWYNATGTTLYVLGMLASAFAIGGLLSQGGAG